VLLQPFGVQFRIAASHDEERFGMTPMRLRDELARTAVAEVRDGAGVDDVYIRCFVEVALYEACRRSSAR